MHLAQTFFEQINFIFCYFCDRNTSDTEHFENAIKRIIICACFQQQAIFKAAAISFPPVSIKNNDWFGMRNRSKNSEFAIHETIFSNFDNNKPFLRSIYLWHRIFIALLEGQLLPGNISYCDTWCWTVHGEFSTDTKINVESVTL